jgi:hypothetical protein
MAVAPFISFKRGTLLSIIAIYAEVLSPHLSLVVALLEDIMRMGVFGSGSVSTHITHPAGTFRFRGCFLRSSSAHFAEEILHYQRALKATIFAPNLFSWILEREKGLEGGLVSGKGGRGGRGGGVEGGGGGV